jgi:hypothetical protein
VEALQVKREESAGDQCERAITRRRAVPFTASEQCQERECHNTAEERHHGW